MGQGRESEGLRCVSVRERETDRDKVREREREGKGGGANLAKCEADSSLETRTAAERPKKLERSTLQ